MTVTIELFYSPTCPHCPNAKETHQTHQPRKIGRRWKATKNEAN